MKKISILLVDDHIVVRQGLKALLAAEPDFEVVGEAENGQQALALARNKTPDVVVMDVAMPQMNGHTATRQILKAHPATRVLVLSTYTNDECVLELLNAGAKGYLMKQTAANELCHAIRHVRLGHQYLSPILARRLNSQRNGAFVHGASDSSRDLTAREVEVLKLIAEGLSNREIGDALGISIKTVEKHRQGTMNKLDIHEVAGLTRYALSKRMVSAKAQVSI
jgi:DNA-binding NarL/FixJ family response regulator